MNKSTVLENNAPLENGSELHFDFMDKFILVLCLLIPGMSCMSWATSVEVSARIGSTAVRTVLFNGKDLKGWHTQGKGIWQVADSSIVGHNPIMDWTHLVTDSSYGDCFMRLKFKNIVGNSGLYFHTDTGGVYGVHGMQIEIDTSDNGSVMWVTTTAYGWVGMTTKVQRDSLVKINAWTDLAVWMQGKNFTVYLNNKKVLQRTNVPEMALNGKFALQMHNGYYNEVYFKDLEVSVPTLSKNCSDPLYLEYQKDLPTSDPGVCGTVSVTGGNGQVPFKVDLTQPNRYLFGPKGYRDLAGKHRYPRNKQ